MKTWRMARYCLAVAWTLLLATFVAATPVDSTLVLMCREMSIELNDVHAEYRMQCAQLDARMTAVDRLINEAGRSPQLEEKHLRALFEKIQLMEERRLAGENYQANLTKTRFRKGLELTKLLYEKILALDHHFTSLQTYQNVMLLSNPNTFPEFQKTKALLEDRMKKRTMLKMPGLLESNPFMSAAFSLVASIVGDGEPAAKEKELENIACILDFTVRMNNDLSLIYYETEYLKEGNRSLKEDCKSLFTDYVKPLGYFTGLETCRKQDDWETVYGKLDEYVLKMDGVMAKPDELSRREAYKYQADLEFSVDRLIDFINKYAAFISQGEKYYQKFQVIVSSYANEEVCSSRLPKQFGDLKRDIGFSIEKFNESYNIAEIKGSKMKDLLYGYSN